MTIEIHSPYQKVDEKFLLELEREIMHLSNLNKDISRAEINFRIDDSASFENKICEIRLTIYSDNLFSRRVSSNFEEAAREVISDLHAKVVNQALLKNELPDELTTSIEI